MFKFSKLTYSYVISFFLGIVCVMFNLVWQPIIYAAVVLFAVGFILLTISLYFSANKKIRDEELIKEELLMELVTTEDGQEYVMKNNPDSKKYKRALRKDKFNKYLPMIFSGVLALTMIFFLIKLIIKF